MARGPVGRRGAGVLDLIRRLDAGTILMTLLVLGLALRVFIAAVYLPLSGLSNDIGDFTAWGQRLASLGPAGFYEPGYFSDYPPGLHVRPVAARQRSAARSHRWSARTRPAAW